MEESQRQQRMIQDKCIELRRKVKLDRTDEAYEQLRQAENERHRTYYKIVSESEKERSTKWQKEQSKIIITCDVCNCQIKKTSLYDHRKSKKHLDNLKQQGIEKDPFQIPNERIKCECGQVLVRRNLAIHLNSETHSFNLLFKK